MGRWADTSLVLLIAAALFTEAASGQVPQQAQTPRVSSVEWAVRDSQIVAVGRAEEVLWRSRSARTGQSPRVVVVISEVIKASGSAEVRVGERIELPARMQGLGFAGLEIVICMPATIGQVLANRSSDLAPVNRVVPERTWRTFGGVSAYRMDGSTPADRESFLRTLRAAAEYREAGGGRVGSDFLTLFVLEEKWSEKSAWLIRPKVEIQVPVDARLREVVLRLMRSPDPASRLAGVRLAAHFPDAEVISEVRGLLRDTMYQVTPLISWHGRVSERGARAYPIREAALGVLRRWGENWTTDSAPVVEAHSFYRPVRWWAVSLLLITFVGTGICGGRRGIGSMGGWVTWGCAMLALPAALTWYGGKESPESLAFAMGGASFELMSHDGSLLLLRVGDEAPAQGLMRREDRAWLSWSRPWFWRHLASTDHWTFGPVQSWRGTVSRAPQQHAFRLLQVRWWVVVAALMIWPATWCAVRGFRELRRRRRVKRGRCGGCGYDLRGSGGNGGGRRCPECGGIGVVNVAGVDRRQVCAALA